MRLAILSANDAEQAYFIGRLAEAHEIAGVVVDRRYTPGDRLRRLWVSSGRRPDVLAANVVRKLRLRAEEREEWRLHARHFGRRRPSEITEHPVIVSDNLNAPETVGQVRALAPDAVVVFGTRLLKEPMIRASPKGAVNLHTGLSPYYRGGHATFFCLWNNEPQFIGATAHFIDPGIDSGEILRTARPAIEPGDTLYSLECKVILLGTELMLDALRRVEAGAARGVRQWSEGRLYLSREFTLQRRIELAARMRRGLLADYCRRAGAAAEDGVRLVE